MRYRVTFNRHRYQDCSDSPSKGTRVFKAESTDDAWYLMAEIREESNKRTEVEFLSGQHPSSKPYIGLIDNLVEPELVR